MFGWTRIFTLVAVAAAVAIVTGGAGATSTATRGGGAGATSRSIASEPAATSTSTHAPATVSHAATAGKVSPAASRRATLPNLSTRAGVVRYLRAIGLDPRGVAIQRGARNYAGPNCPGAGWACTSTAHSVVQIAAAGGKNIFFCTTGRCAVVQRSLTAATATNTAKCIKTTGLSQSCSISQTSASANNEAIVVEGQVAGAKASGLTQTASYSAQITQTATGGLSVANGNTACVLQVVNIDGSTQAKKGTPVVVKLNGRQSVSTIQDSLYGNNVVQNATPSGTCAGDDTPLTQSQTLSSSANGSAYIEQDLNATATVPNIQLDVKQNKTQTTPTDSLGENHVWFSQSSNLSAVAGTPNGPVVQKQGTDAGGIQATVNQFAHGISTVGQPPPATPLALQTEIQCEHAQIGPVSSSSSCTTGIPPSYSLTQTQSGPVRKGAGPSIQGDNSGDTFTFKQSSTQNNDTGQNQTNLVQGDCTTSGSCTVTQETNVNGATANNTQTGSSVNTQITCSGTTCTPSSGTTGSVSASPSTITASNVDVGEFGVGGMRGGPGTGSISVSGITAPVIGAFLYWNGPTNSTDATANASVMFAGNPVTGTNIGFASDNNWGFLNTQSYRANVTAMVTANGSYSLADFTKLPDVDINGVSLIVFYNDANSANDRNVVLWNGNDSNVLPGPSPYGTDGWDETLANVPYQGGSASLDLVVADGQYFNDDAVKLNGTTISSGSAIFQGDSVPPSAVNGLWDVKSFDISSLLTSGMNSLQLTTGVVNDYLSLVVAIANMPASAPVIG